MLTRIFIFLVAGYFLFLSSAFAVNSDKKGQEAVAASSSSTLDTLSDDDFDAEFDDDFASPSRAPQKLISDPFQTLNRGVFWFNDKIYFYFLKPVARGYRYVMPRPARASIRNVFSNLMTPIRAGNSLLQLNFRRFGTEIYRFVINTTFGIGGLFDPARSIAGVEKSVEDFGQTLGYYGVGHGFYLVLPIIGPSSLRDVSGNFVDSFAYPLRYTDLHSLEFAGLVLFDIETRLSLDRDTYEGIVHDAIDPYLFIRSAYAQRRLAQVGADSHDINFFQMPIFDSDLLNPFEWFGLKL
jgi:phospholipid-binding lipoprotein MlaA